MMFGSIYIGMSGLNAYSKGLETVSNNVSNMNTQGFKAADVTFSNIYGAGSQGGLDYGGGRTGKGHGVSVNELTTNFSQGELRQTGRDLDLAIDGNGFLVLLDGDRQLYTRTGSFAVNEDGFIVMQGTDYKLGVLDEQGRPRALNIDSQRTSPPEATTRITFADNLSSTATEFSIPDLQVYGSDGEEHVWSVAFARPETVSGKWSVTVTDAEGNEVGMQTLEFIDGKIVEGQGELVFEDEENALSVTLDFADGVTSFSSGSVSTLRADDIDGYATGALATLTINDEGVIEITYTNEETVELGAVALADFRDPQSLEQRGKCDLRGNRLRPEAIPVCQRYPRRPCPVTAAGSIECRSWVAIRRPHPDPARLSSQQSDHLRH